MLDAWAALERSRGRARMVAVRAMLEQDAQRRFETGEGATIPVLASNDPRLAGYVAGTGPAPRVPPGRRRPGRVVSLVTPVRRRQPVRVAAVLICAAMLATNSP
jgi:hypothetical protein